MLDVVSKPRLRLASHVMWAAHLATSRLVASRDATFRGE
jgi:hypothetical protein